MPALAISAADRPLARHCVTNQLFGVLSNDSDFFIFDVPRYFPLDSLAIYPSAVYADCYESARTAKLLRLRGKSVRRSSLASHHKSRS
jgi:hypothetical protein